MSRNQDRRLCSCLRVQDNSDQLHFDHLDHKYLHHGPSFKHAFEFDTLALSSVNYLGAGNNHFGSY